MLTLFWDDFLCMTPALLIDVLQFLPLIRIQSQISSFFVILGVNSIDINFGPKMGPRCQIENWPIGRPWQAFTHWQNWAENGPENWPEIFYVNSIDPQDPDSDPVKSGIVIPLSCIGLLLFPISIPLASRPFRSS